MIKIVAITAEVFLWGYNWDQIRGNSNNHIKKLAFYFVPDWNSIYSFCFLINLQTVPTTRLASLPPTFIGDKPYATQYGLALTLLPPEDDDKNQAVKNFEQDALNRDLLLNVEYK